MTKPPALLSTRAELARLLLLWLVAVLCLQGFASARALALGPSHHHLAQAIAPGASTWVPLLVHASNKAAAAPHAHSAAERHHHHKLDTSVIGAQQDANLDGASASLLASLLATMSLALLPAWALALPAPNQVLLASAAALPWASHSTLPPRRPPRALGA